ncbi:MAG: hypothetical protein MRY83_17960 [Flavobacteriales bacterium]|nr:hypothetical protein [Flavobacteriales bacterium]
MKFLTYFLAIIAFQVSVSAHSLKIEKFMDEDRNAYFIVPFKNLYYPDESDSLRVYENKGDQDLLVTKYSEDGKYLWSAHFLSPQRIDNVQLSQFQDGKLFVVGTFVGLLNIDDGNQRQFVDNDENSAYFFAEITSEGVCQNFFSLSKEYMDNSKLTINDVDYGMGRFHITGFFSGSVDLDLSNETHYLNSSAPFQAFTASYELSGGLIWVYGPEAETCMVGNAVTEDNDGNVYFTGHIKDPNTKDEGSNGRYAFVSKFDKNGTYMDGFILEGTDLFESHHIQVGGNNVWIAGIFRGGVDFNPDTVRNISFAHNTNVFLAKYESNGELLDYKTFSDSTNLQASDLWVDQNQVLLIHSRTEMPYLDRMVHIFDEKIIYEEDVYGFIGKPHLRINNALQKNQSVYLGGIDLIYDLSNKDFISQAD